MKSLRKFGRWIGNQVDGFLRGLMSLTTTSPRRFLPGTAWSTLRWVGRSVSWSLGTSTAKKQITSSLALLMLAIVTSWITLGATIVLVVFFTVTMLIGFARLIPAVERGWCSVRDTLVPRA